MKRQRAPASHAKGLPGTSHGISVLVRMFCTLVFSLALYTLSNPSGHLIGFQYPRRPLPPCIRQRGTCGGINPIIFYILRGRSAVPPLPSALQRLVLLSSDSMILFRPLFWPGLWCLCRALLHVVRFEGRDCWVGRGLFFLRGVVL